MEINFAKITGYSFVGGSICSGGLAGLVCMFIPGWNILQGSVLIGIFGCALIGAVTTGVIAYHRQKKEIEQKKSSLEYCLHQTKDYMVNHPKDYNIDINLLEEMQNSEALVFKILKEYYAIITIAQVLSCRIYQSTDLNDTQKDGLNHLLGQQQDLELFKVLEKQVLAKKDITCGDKILITQIIDSYSKKDIYIFDSKAVEQHKAVKENTDLPKLSNIISVYHQLQNLEKTKSDLKDKLNENDTDNLKKCITEELKNRSCDTKVKYLESTLIIKYHEIIESGTTSIKTEIKEIDNKDYTALQNKVSVFQELSEIEYEKVMQNTEEEYRKDQAMNYMANYINTLDPDNKYGNEQIKMRYKKVRYKKIQRHYIKYYTNFLQSFAKLKLYLVKSI